MARVDESFNRFSETARVSADAAAQAGAIIDESLLQTASGANALDLANARVSASRNKLEAATRAQARAETELLNIQRQVAATGRTDADVLRAQAAAADRLTAAEKEAAAATRALRDAEARQAAASRAAAGSTDAAAASASRFSRATGAAATAAKTMAKGALIVTAAAAGIAYESIKAATSYQTLTTRLVTSAGETSGNLELVRKGMMDIAATVGETATEEAKGMYTVESAGYHGAQGLTVLKAASEGAKTEGADFAEVSNAVTDALKDYHLKASAAGDVTSKLITAVSFGKTNFQALAKSMSNILPFAASVHLKMQDVVGVLAEMTSHGVTAQRASQNIANAMRSLIAPNKAMIKEFEAVGITSNEVSAKLGSAGLAGTMQWLAGIAKEKAPAIGQNYNEALKKLMGTAPGLSVALMTTGENAEETNKAIAGIGKATTDANGNVAGFTDLQGTLAYKIDKVKAELMNTAIVLGNALIPAVTEAAAWLGRIIQPIAGWISKHQTLTKYLLIGAIAIGVLTLAITILTTVITVLFSEVGLIVLAIAALAIGVIYAYTHFKIFRTIVDDVASFFKTVFIDSWKAVGAVIDWFNTTVMGNFKAAMDYFRTWWKSNADEIRQVWKYVWSFAEGIIKTWWNGFMKPMLSIWKQSWKTAWDFIRDVAKAVWANIHAIIIFYIHLIMNTIAVILDVITGHWGKAWKDLKKLASQAMSDAVNGIKAAASGFATLLWDAGANIIKGLIGGMKSMINGVKDTIGGIANTIRNHLPFSPAKEGPLSGSGSPELGGQKIVKMISQGLVSGVPMATAAMRQVTGVLSGQMTSAGARVSAGSLRTLAASAGGGGNVYYFDLRGSQVMSDRDMDNLVNKIGNRVATRTLPAGGTHIRY